ncbi:MAG TPA: arginine deiminase-related protein [Xanthomonadaceae bacterium]|nr:arginine deiminase-related protein [Xanthomonadaceae bacterium]
MLTRDIDAFVNHARTLRTDFGSPTARAAFLVAPEGFALATESARDNRYMASAADFEPARAMAQHRQLHRALSAQLPVVGFAGDPDAPDGLFPNNVFATAPGRLIVGRMRHPVRQREAGREDIRGFFQQVLGYETVDLSRQPHTCELTGALVIDRLRGIGFCGLSERCDAEGAALMHAAFGLRATLLFDLAPGEYHTNVVLAVLAGRAALLSPAGFADPAVADAICALYEHGLRVGPAAHAAFACNAIALTSDAAWMSEGAAGALGEEVEAGLADAGFAVRAVALDAIEAAGGSLRCCVAEIF